ncbi:hypothetical protein KFL_000810180 [Klebsormidium nitens]|uniref:Thiaminase-2/PQQC domain-containing protein n=1 Tax=Klebsormidium nitens TaxID=105231 RepID=A0A1Y1HY75_KLENI|nr:hypothetical protein KFL_000810180 [Klebsormidium nitens]|eukprot:GAQ81476.1 hypothetical protein KFL_000810180 [Klebsormidium nitens]
MMNRELPKGDVSPPSISERLWQSCSDLATKALTGAFISQLAAGTLKKVSFQHYIAQDAFFLTAFCETYELVEERVSDADAKGALRDLRDAALRELGMHAGYAKAWDIDLGDYAQPSAATRNYIDFLRRAASGSTTVTASSPPENGANESQSTQTVLSNGSNGADWEANGKVIGEGESERDSRSELEARTANGALQERADINNHTTEGGSSRDSQITEVKSKNRVAGDTLDHDAARMIAALVPCMRLYAFLGTELRRGRDLTGHPYREWIETYASQDFQASASKLEAVLDSVCGQDTSFEALSPTYRTAMLLELDFFAAQPGL